MLVNPDSLSLHPLGIGDLPALRSALDQEPEDRLGISHDQGLPRPQDSRRARPWLQGQEQEWTVGRAFAFGIWVPGEGLVGTLRIGCLCWRRRTAQLSYWIAPAKRCRGHGTRAGHRALGVAFHCLELRSLRSFVASDNKASRRLLERLGFRRWVRSRPIHWNAPEQRILAYEYRSGSESEEGAAERPGGAAWR